jgi:recombinational DNA repair protein (RecF pathway)
MGDAEWRDAFPRDLGDDAELLASVSRLNETFHEIAPATLKFISNIYEEFLKRLLHRDAKREEVLRIYLVTRIGNFMPAW